MDVGSVSVADPVRMRRHQSQLTIGGPAPGPPKPPRDPSRMSTSTSSLGPRQNTTLFIWKEPPSLPPDPPPEPVPSGVKLRRKDPHKAARRHTLSHGLDASMVKINREINFVQSHYSQLDMSI